MRVCFSPHICNVCFYRRRRHAQPCGHLRIVQSIVNEFQYLVLPWCQIHTLLYHGSALWTIYQNNSCCGFCPGGIGFKTRYSHSPPALRCFSTRYPPNSFFRRCLSWALKLASGYLKNCLISPSVIHFPFLSRQNSNTVSICVLIRCSSCFGSYAGPNVLVVILALKSLFVFLLE